VLDRVLTAPGAIASWQYRYDRDSRLVKATLAGSRMPAGVKTGDYQYTFNAQSQRIRTVSPGRDVEFAYDESTGRMTATSDARFAGGFAYDARGRATSAGPLSLTYGVGGGVASIADSSSGVTVSNILDASGVIGQTIRGPEGQGGTVHYSAQGLLLNGDGSVASRIVSLPGGVSVQRYKTGSSTWRYADGLGNIAWQSDGSDAPKTTTLFDPDGNRLGTVPAVSLDPSRPDLGWAGGSGKVTSPTSVATVAMGTRTYVPALATFLQPDPVPGAAPTPYAYVPDPINASDSTGALPEWASTLIKVAVATVISGVIIAKTAGTGALCAKVIFQNIVAGAVAGATGEAAAQGAAIGVDAAIDGEIEEHNDWDWGEVGIAAAAGAGAEAGGAALAWRASRSTGIQRAVDDALDEAFSGLSATDDLISGAGLNLPRRTQHTKKVLVDRTGSPLPIGVDNHKLTQQFKAPFTKQGGFKNKALEALPEASAIDEVEPFSVQGFGRRTGPLDNGFADSFVADDDLAGFITFQ
jgi:RHS repeat-associated protein